MTRYELVFSGLTLTVRLTTRQIQANSLFLAYPNGVPQTEAVNNLLHSNITYNIDGNSQEGVTSQDEMEPMLYQSGLKLYDYAHNTDIGGTMDPEPTPMDKYLAAHGKSGVAAVILGRN